MARVGRQMLYHLPTLEEAGVKGYEMTYWFGAYVPAKTAPATVKRLSELLHGLSQPSP